VGTRREQASRIPHPPAPLESLILHALTSTQDYWAGLALAWAAEMSPTHRVIEALGDLEKAPWALRRFVMELGGSVGC
jgi:hypothetical protein